MIGSLSGQVTAMTQAVRALERVLTRSRIQWDDAARRTFDRRHGDQIAVEANRTLAEMDRLAQELAAAASVLDGLSPPR